MKNGDKTNQLGVKVLWWQLNATKNTFTDLGWEINPVFGGNIVTYGCGGVLSTLAVTVLLLRRI